MIVAAVTPAGFEAVSVMVAVCSPGCNCPAWAPIAKYRFTGVVKAPEDVTFSQAGSVP